MLERLARIIGDPSYTAEERVLVLDLLAEIGPQARSVERALRSALEKPDRGLPVTSVARTLWKVTRDAEPHIEVIRAHLSSEHRSSWALPGARELGPLAGPLVPVTDQVFSNSHLLFLTTSLSKSDLHTVNPVRCRAECPCP